MTRILLCMVLLLLDGCVQSTIDYDTAMSLLKRHELEPVRIAFSASPRFAQDEYSTLKSAYESLAAAHVLDCRDDKVLGVLCQPGPAGLDVQRGGGNLAIVAGHWITSVISEIKATGTDSAEANVRVSFEPSPLYQEFRYQFDKFQSPAAINQLMEGKAGKARFEKYPDGWHLINLDLLQ
jgi:hypothetical protein